MIYVLFYKTTLNKKSESRLGNKNRKDDKYKKYLCKVMYFEGKTKKTLIL